jgi:hypothetical protein
LGSNLLLLPSILKVIYCICCLDKQDWNFQQLLTSALYNIELLDVTLNDVKDLSFLRFERRL